MNQTENKFYIWHIISTLGHQYLSVETLLQHWDLVDSFLTLNSKLLDYTFFLSNSLFSKKKDICSQDDKVFL